MKISTFAMLIAVSVLGLIPCASAQQGIVQAGHEALAEKVQVLAQDAEVDPAVGSLLVGWAYVQDTSIDPASRYAVVRKVLTQVGPSAFLRNGVFDPNAGTLFLRLIECGAIVARDAQQIGYVEDLKATVASTVERLDVQLPPRGQRPREFEAWWLGVLSLMDTVRASDTSKVQGLALGQVESLGAALKLVLGEEEGARAWSEVEDDVREFLVDPSPEVAARLLDSDLFKEEVLQGLMGLTAEQASGVAAAAVPLAGLVFGLVEISDHWDSMSDGQRVLAVSRQLANVALGLQVFATGATAGIKAGILAVVVPLLDGLKLFDSLFGGGSKGGDGDHPGGEGESGVVAPGDGDEDAEGERGAKGEPAPAGQGHSGTAPDVAEESGEASGQVGDGGDAEAPTKEQVHRDLENKAAAVMKAPPASELGQKGWFDALRASMSADIRKDLDASSHGPGGVRQRSGGGR